MTEKKKGAWGGWFRESMRHSLASKGVKTGHLAKPRTPRVPKTQAQGPRGVKTDNKPTAKEILYSEDDDGYRACFTDSENGEQLVLIGEAVDSLSGEIVGVVFEREDGSHVVRSPDEVVGPPE